MKYKTSSRKALAQTAKRKVSSDRLDLQRWVGAFNDPSLTVEDRRRLAHELEAELGLEKLSRRDRSIARIELDELAGVPTSTSREDAIATSRFKVQVTVNEWLLGQSQIWTQILLDLVNLRDQSAVAWFWSKHNEIVNEGPDDLIELRNELRRIWVPKPESPWPDDDILNKWLDWRPTAEQIAAYSSESETERLRRSGRLPVREVYRPFRCWGLLGRLIPDLRFIRPMLIQGVLEHWENFRYCANPDCVAPYFIAKRKDQTVCDAGPCKAEKQREHARKWWNEHRAKNIQKKAEAASKTTKREGARNVSKETR